MFKSAFYVVGLNWQDTIIGDWLSGVASDFLSTYFGMIGSFYSDAEKSFLNAREIASLTTVMSGIATALISAIVLWKVINTYFTETDGDADQDPMQLFVKASIAVAAIQVEDLLFNWVIQLGSNLTTDIIKGVGGFEFRSAQDISDQITDLFNTVSGTTKAIILIVFAIGTLIFLFQGVVRAAELALQKIIFPIFCCDLLSASKEKFSAFVTSFVITACCYGIQMFTYSMSIRALLQEADSNFGMLAFGWLFLSIKAPKWIEKYAYSSGVGGLAKSGAQSATQVIMMSAARKGA